MKTKKYMCVGGFVISESGDRHYIDAYQVPALYNVDPAECVIVVRDSDLYGFRRATLKILRPQSNGNYLLK